MPLIWVSQGGVRAPAVVDSNIFFSDATIDGKNSAPVILDTGAPFSLLMPGPFGGAVPSGAGFVGSLTIGGVTMLHVPTIDGTGTELEQEPGLGGIVGFTAFGQFQFSLNYRDKSVSLGSTSLPSGLEANSTTLPFALEGGGRTRVDQSTVIDSPASRVIVPIEIEGENHEVLVDSGSSFVGLRRSVFDRLSADGRVTLQEDFLLASEQAAGRLIRLRSVAIGGEVVADSIGTAADPDPKTGKLGGLELLLDLLSSEVGHPVDGMVGGTVLREFYVTFGYPEGRLILRRYTTRDHIHDEFRRVGISLIRARLGNGIEYVVRRVYPATDAELKLAQARLGVDDVVKSIDGTALSSVDPASVDDMLLGNVGDTHRIGFETTTLDIRVDDLLPLP